MSLLLNMLSRLAITFLPRSKYLLISWLQSAFAAILEPKKIKSVIVSIVSPSICHEEMGPNAMISCFFECWVWSQFFHSPLSLSSRGSLVLLLFLPQGWCYLHIWGYCYFSQHLAWTKCLMDFLDRTKYPARAMTSVLVRGTQMEIRTHKRRLCKDDGSREKR